MGNFATPYGRVIAKNATFTALLSDKPDGYLITAATVPVVATLFDPKGQFGGFASGFGNIRVINSASSLNIVVVATAAGSIIGNTILLPGQSAIFTSDGGGNWYNFDPASPASVSVAITAANFLALNTTPKSLVPAPGSGYIVIPNHFLFTMTRTGTAFANGGALEFRYTNASGAKVSADIAAAVVTTGGAGVELAAVGGIVSAITPVANAAVVVNAASADFITGTGTAVCRATYRVIPQP